MSVHQVITGALNSGENTFSIGCIDNVNFIACAVGTDVAVLAPNFDRVQIIPGEEASNGEVVSAVSCCTDTGKIAAVYGHIVRIFEPSYLASAGSLVPYQWTEAHRISAPRPVTFVQWVLEGLRLLVMFGTDLILYQHQLLSTAVKESSAGVKFSINEEKSSACWDVLWKTTLPFDMKYVKFSPDGTLFATCGKHDNLVKIWYQQNETFAGKEVRFSYTYLQHPVAVTGFEWRRTSRYMPRKCVQNVIITWCQDNTSRIWKQTPNNNSQLEALIEAVDVVSKNSENAQKVRHKGFKIKKARTKLVKKISQLIQREVTTSRSHSSSTGSGLTRTATFADFMVPASTLDSLHFFLVATIDAENDCFLVPSLNSGTSAPRQPFVIHWLNNKELMFTHGAEKILSDAISQDHFDLNTRASSKAKSVSPQPPDDEQSEAGSLDMPDQNPLTRTPSLPTSTGSPYDNTNFKDMLDTRLEGLMREWNKGVDVVFSVYPVDGSLLTWTIEWLDDTWRQPIVNFSSRFPNAFPLTDAASLNLSLFTFNPYNPIYTDAHHSPDSANFDKISHKLDETPKNTIHLLTSHFNGSLNLWDLTTEESCAFSHILNIMHKSRMCGHRFHISKVMAHPVLPLLLTASQSAPPPNGGDRESELILWKVSPVSPLCKSGGVRELARLTSNSPAAFESLSWIPAILPSSTLGTVCNSPSSCFIASNNGRLCIYQAVVDARGLLSELYSAKLGKRSVSSSLSSLNDVAATAEPTANLVETFDVVSTQSTARPGCVLLLGEVLDSDHIPTDMLTLHVFNEELTIKNNTTNDLHPEHQNSLVIDRSRSSTFSDNYFVVMVVRTATEDRLKMWSLVVSSQPPVPIKNYVDDDGVKPDADGPFYPIAAPNPPSAAKLVITSKMVYDERIDLPFGVRVTSCVVSAGHLPSASLYPACRAPYLLAIACSDDYVRFLRCSADVCADGSAKYEWSYWKMVSNNINSSLEMDGEIYTISSAHSGRFAAAFRSPNAGDHKTTTSLTQDLEVAVFECESSGGVEWLQEDCFNLERYVIETAGTKNLLSSFDRCDELDSNLPLVERVRRLVRLDWVSAEDGSHILTVGLGQTIYLFAQVSRDVAQQNVVMMKDNETRGRSLRKASSLVGNIHNSNRLVRWMCIRTLELQSADGLPPLPTAMSWVRDGMLVVGLHSEMRIYNQWNPTYNAVMDSKPAELTVNLPPVESDLSSPSTQKPSMTISRSHSMLEQLNKRAKHDVSGSKMIKEIMTKVFSNMHVTETSQVLPNKDDLMLKALSEEGLFEASRLANPMLPQYHPKQLIEMLNSGKTKRVKAIFLHIIRTLKQRNVSGGNALNRAASVRRLTTTESMALGDDGPSLQPQRSVAVFEDDNPEFEELGGIPPLSLFALLEADEAATGDEKAANINDSERTYDTLFGNDEDEDDLDEMLTDVVEGVSRRSRHSSGTSMDQTNTGRVQVTFTTRHCRILTELLTHMHLPGLSSVDQMHLLSIADTLSHFSSSTIDRLIHANAAFNSGGNSGTNDIVPGYSNAAGGIESVDECGLRFMMAMKQHEYLIRCLPIKQRQQLKSTGLPTAHIIWAFHSDTETELLNAIPCCQRGQETWEELRSFGIAWWLKNTSTLRTVVEKMAKSAFQQKQEPMDSSLYYLALRKKNVLTHLFKSVNDPRMADFFREDFTQERWKKAALKNAFVLMSKQRFQHAAAFFLLADCLKDALQTIIRRLNDIQLAMVILRLFETDVEKQTAMMMELLCSEILGVDVSVAQTAAVTSPSENTYASPTHGSASHDPFERSMAYWLVKNYAKAAATLLDEANKACFTTQGALAGWSISDIFNLYSFLRRHPLVTRQRLTDAGIKVGGTEQFLQLARELESRVTPSERRLFFRTASVHMASGCPLLALDVLRRLPRQLSNFLPDNEDIADALNECTNGITIEVPSVAREDNAGGFDWSAPTNVVKDDELELKWSDDDEEEDEDQDDDAVDFTVPTTSTDAKEEEATAFPVASGHTIDFISQHLKFVAALRVFMEELATLASGFEVDGGQLRFELFRWLERECVVLRDVCDYQMDLGFNPAEGEGYPEDIADLLSLKLSDLRFEQGMFCRSPSRRRLWLYAHQKLIRTFTSYCALHSAQNYRLTSVLMELLLLLLELQQDKTISFAVDEAPKIRPFPLLSGSLAAGRMFLSSPLHFIENQSNDLLLTIAEMHEPLRFNSGLPTVYELYNLCQGLSSCLYQSLSDADNFGFVQTVDGMFTRKITEDIHVINPPSQWPGVQSFIALLDCEKDEEFPNLRLLIAECFTAITMCLFCYSFSLYDSRWLYRLVAHDFNAKSFGILFGGAGEQKIRQAPVRPPPINADALSSSHGDSIRAKLHARVFGSNVSVDPQKRPENFAAHVVSCWVPPRKHVVQYFAEKVESTQQSSEYDYDSDDAVSHDSFEDDESTHDDIEPRPHDVPNSYAWHLLRLALVMQQRYRLKQFLQLLNVDLNELPLLSPKISRILKLLESWIEQLNETLESFPDGCPSNLIPITYVEANSMTHNAPLIRKYRTLIEKGNTPFEYDAKGVPPVRRLWSYLVRQEHLSSHFIKYIFEKQGVKESDKEPSIGSNSNTGSTVSTPVVKIMHREQEAILAFATNNAKLGWIAVSTGREIQEICMESLFEEQQNLADSKTSYLNNRVALDIALDKNTRDTLKDNDDYQVLIDGKVKANSSFLRKRRVNGVRRLEPHPSLPYYVSGSSDGSILLWEWGLEQPLFTARSAGQYAKVTKLAFSVNGNKFAAVDGDGLLCMWQAAQSVSVRKPYFNQKCHSKMAADVKFLGQTSSLLVTVGHSSGDANVSLWDTLMPSNKATVHSFVGHPDGAMCVGYLPNSQTIISGGRHGEICLWDIRQRQLRSSLKVFDSAAIVKSLCVDPNSEYFVVGSSDGDIKVFNTDLAPVQVCNFAGEHAARGGFSLRQVGIQGVQQLSFDSTLRLFSCGADCSLKFRSLPSVVSLYG